MEKNTFERIVDEVVASSPPFAAARVYKELKIKYGKPSGQWKLWCKRPKSEKERTEVIIGAVLTQRTNWKNVQLAINNLKKAKINSLRGIYRTGKRSLAPLIKPAGFYKTKSRYLFSLIKFIFKKYGSLAKMKRQDVEELREKLLKIKGIGPETADSILLYALDKPVFVIDEYTRRLIKKRKLSQNLSYDFLQKLFEKNLKPRSRIWTNCHLRSKSKFHYGVKRDFRLYQDFHAVIVIDGKNGN